VIPDRKRDKQIPCFGTLACLDLFLETEGGSWTHSWLSTNVTASLGRRLTTVFLKIFRKSYFEPALLARQKLSCSGTSKNDAWAAERDVSGWWVRPPGGRVKNTHQAMVCVDPGHDPLDAKTTKKSCGCSWKWGCGKPTQKTNIRRPRIVGVVRYLCVRVRSSSGGSSERRCGLVLTLSLRGRTNCRRNLRSMCLIASSLNPFPPVVCVCFSSQEKVSDQARW
jgi:hypothetical protein